MKPRGKTNGREEIPVEEIKEIREPEKTPRTDWRAYVCILSGAALWGMIGLWNRHLIAGGFSPWSIV